MKTLAIFDFDQTLVMTPQDNKENREILLKKRGYTRPGWWGRPETIDIDLFDIPLIPWVKDRYDEHKRNAHEVILMTGRIIKLKEAVLKVIDHHGLEFDRYYLADGRKTLDFKLDNIDRIVRGGEYGEVIIYDDRTSHIPHFRKLCDTLEDDLNISARLFHVVGHSGYELKYKQKIR